MSHGCAIVCEQHGVRLGEIRKGATLCPGDSGSQDNTADFLF
jgi:hypothetical protein